MRWLRCKQALLAACGNPGIHPAIQNVQRQRAGVEHLVVKGSKVKLGAELYSGALT